MVKLHNLEKSLKEKNPPEELNIVKFECAILNY